MNRTFDVAVVGATGAVGEAMIEILEQRKFPVRQLYPLASSRSAGKTVRFQGRDVLVGDLAELDLPARGIDAGFDVIVSAGTVMGFLAPSTRVEVLRRFAGPLAAGGRAIIGFGAGRGYEFPEFLADANAAGLELDQAFSTWDLRPVLPDSDFLVAILTAAE